MSQKYSMNGYLNAITIRSGATLLVEGIADKALMHRFKAPLQGTQQRDFVVDTVDIFDTSDGMQGMGAKEKVIRAIQAAAQANLPNLTSKLGTFIDNEWDGIDLDALDHAATWTSPPQSNGRYSTVGHSCENYHFAVSCVRDYLFHAFAEHVSQPYLAALNDDFPSILGIAGSISYEAKAQQLLTRIQGMCRWQHIQRHANGRFYLTPAFAAQMTLRNVDSNVANSFVQSVNARIDTSWSAMSSMPSAKWLLHGHLGEDAMWASVAEIGTRFGVPPHVADSIGNGHRHERMQFWHSWLIVQDSSSRAPIDDVLAWLTTHPAGAT